MKALQTAAATAAATVVVLLSTGAKTAPPRKALPPPCEVQCLEAKNAALQKLAVKRLKGWRRMELKRNQWKTYALRLRGGDARARSKSSVRVSGGVKGVICSVFGAHCSEALRVAQCESRFNIYARNPNPPAGDAGDYLGLFQFGDFARSHYGFAWDALTQTRAAYRYFLDAGWSPWSCKP